MFSGKSREGRWDGMGWDDAVFALISDYQSVYRELSPVIKIPKNISKYTF